MFGVPPFQWQWRLFDGFVRGEIPGAVDLPTGLGKTSVMGIWLLARAFNAELPRRLVYVVDRRVVVDQATNVAQQLRDNLLNNSDCADISERLGLGENIELPISTLRGQMADNRLWLEDPTRPAIIIGTVDMIGSRLLFSGYRTGRWMRPLHAALLGVDSLIVLDEAHLVPAFNRALSFAVGQRLLVCPPTPLPPLKLLPLSATAQTMDDDNVFRLRKEDFNDETVAKRLQAVKRLSFEELDDDKAKLPDVLAEKAFMYDGEARTVSVFCNSRKDAQAAAEALRKKLGKGRGGDIRSLTGARRGHERDALSVDGTFMAFQGHFPEDGRTRYLVCTAAGEVGADLDAHQSVMDLVSLERMIQRIGRVNRRGDAQGGSTIIVLVAGDRMKKTETGGLDLYFVWDILENLPAFPDGNHDASPEALEKLLRRLPPECGRFSFTPAPPTPAFDKAHLEAWAMTSLDDHPGRPEVAPFLRGIEDEAPQTTLVWRNDVAVLARLEQGMILQAMEAAPPRPPEILEQDAVSAVQSVVTRLMRLMARVKDGGADFPPLPLIALRGNRIEDVVLIKKNSVTVGRRSFQIGQEKILKAVLIRLFANSMVLLPLEFGGLDNDGLFTGKIDDPAFEPPMDDFSRLRLKVDMNTGVPEILGSNWPKNIDQGADWATRLRRKGWRCTFSTPLPLAAGFADGNPTHRIEYWAPPRAGRMEGETGTAPRAQTLFDHLEWTRNEILRMSRKLNLPEWLENLLVMAAKYHDAGKSRDVWQHAMKAEREPPDLARPLAKTSNRGCGHLGGYRHEFGSLLDAQEDAGVKGLADDHRDLLLHLIAAHHGRARPAIPAIDPDVILPSALDGETLNAAFRFARLQRQWGIWGLAWLEALVRCADATASRKLEE